MVDSIIGIEGGRAAAFTRPGGAAGAATGVGAAAATGSVAAAMGVASSAFSGAPPAGTLASVSRLPLPGREVPPALPLAWVRPL